MSLTPLTFTGVSSMSTDLQTILTRAVSIAKIPLTSLQNQDSDAIQKKTLVNAFTAPLTDLGNAVTALGTLASNNSISATSSDTSKISVTATGASSATAYSITEITSLAAAASETSTSSYANSATTQVSANGSMRLVVGGQNYDFTLTNNNLAGLRDKINGLGAGVSASILTTGQGNYLSIAADTTGATTLKLMDDPSGANTNLITSANQGSNAEFKLNGIAISRSSNTVNDLIPGVTFNVLAKTDANQTVTISLSSDRTQLSTAIQDFADKYNTVLGQVNSQFGQNAGLLSGDFLVREMQNDLRSLGNYEASGTVKTLADMGINFDASGKISFDSTTFNQLSDSQINGAMKFFGTSTTGFGALANKFTQLTDPISGLIKVQSDGYDSTDRRLQKQITDMTDRIDAMQKSVAARLQVADTLLASLESQQSMITANVQSMNYTLYGKVVSN